MIKYRKRNAPLFSNISDKADVLSLLNKDSRFIYLNGFINEDKSKDVIERMLELQSSNPLEEITIVINSCGGEVYSMFAITDTMDIIRPSVRTICIGTSQSAAAFIFICGTKGRRFMTAHSSLMIHQVSGDVGGTTKDIDVTIRHMKDLQEEMIEEISKRSNLSIDKVKEFVDRDFYIRYNKAIEFGLCDDVIKELI